MISIIEVFSTASLLLPKLVIETTGTLGWAPIVIGSIGILLYGLLIQKVTSKIESGFVAFARSLLGKFLGTIVALVFIIKLIFAVVFVLSLFTKIINISLLPLTPSWVIIFCMLVVSSWCACKGLEVRARITEILFWIIIIPIVLILLLAIPELKLDEIVGKSDAGVIDVIKGSYFTFMICSAIELFLFTAPYAEKKKDNRKSIVRIVITIAVLNIALYLTTVGLFGVNGTLRLEIPTLNIMQNVKLPGSLIERMDALMISFWILSIFSVTNAYIFHLATITKEMFKNGKQELICGLYGIIIFGITFFIKDYESMNKLFPLYMSYFGMPITVVIMIIIGITLLIKGDKVCDK
ncbi:MAG: hypothetical protein K0R15_1946 [Clostridiales bacterium]|jgi:spore germination protein (amino acid permease)|nr:hypothetical protein [Clostridiales bacterium]